MIGPSAAHTALALGLQWLFALPFLIFQSDASAAVLAFGMLFGGLWLGREFEQLWPHAGLKPPPDDLTEQDYNRFIRRGAWPIVICFASYVLFEVLT